MSQDNQEALEEAAVPAEPAASQFKHEDQTEAWKSELVVAVDGPSGSGKSSVSREVANRLGLAYLDTGAMYRALTWWCLEAGVDLDDEDAVAEAASDFQLQMGTDPIVETIMVGGTDIRDSIRESRVTDKVSAVAKNQKARHALIARQRMEIVANGRRIVAEGRDITTVVAPDASVRILLTASEDVRMQRRGKQIGASGDEDRLKLEVVQRDVADSKVNNFTEAADGVTLVDSTELNFDQTVQAVIDVIRTTAEQHHEENDKSDNND
ncbi:(d)CMP kinase [Kocuria sp. TGY1127_2]|uniref:(d)CMP kinase n=1 Tax=Kocuria sp. TGY1127_2 TaxID=2711328 RepID=UPI0035301ECB